MISLYAYNQWEPWGYFENLETGKISLLRKAQITVGRSTEYQNEINVRDRTNFVSRMHLIATLDLEVFDNRSLNGSTVNAQFLPYGEKHQLTSGDVIALAGMVVFRFNRIEFAPLKVLQITEREPLKGWLLFVDGLNRKAIPLTAKQYFLSLDHQGQALLSPEEKSRTLLRIEANEQSYVQVFDEEDSSDLFFQFKGDDYTYPERKIRGVNGFAHTRFRGKTVTGSLERLIIRH